MNSKAYYRWITALFLMMLAALANTFEYSARSQTFVLDAVAGGGMGLSIYTPISSGGISLTFSSLHETVILDPVSQTARQIGTIISTPSSAGFTISETQLVPSAFPNPPVSVSATITVNLALAGGNIEFDTGTQPAIWNPAAQAYSINGQIGNIPVAGSYVLSTGGKTYTGTFNYYLSPVLGSAFTYRALKTQGYPEYISLSVTGQEGGMFAYATSVNTVADIVADNGFHMVLSPGSQANWNGGVRLEGFSWGAVDAIALAASGVTDPIVLPPSVPPVTPPVVPPVTIPAQPPAILSLTIDSATEIGSTNIMMNVTITQPAPVGGFFVNLSLAGLDGNFPSSVIIPEGQTNIHFVVTTTQNLFKYGVVTASAPGSTSQTAQLTVVVPPSLGTGSIGPVGPQGPIGLTGPEGPQGPTGAKGLDGAVGPQGPIGLTGPQGPQGPAGANGLDGAVGPQGPIGLTGPQGPQGPAGAKGLDGSVGPQGPIGLTGPQGQQGPTGAKGLDGAVGPQGPIGLTGPQGSQGPQGLIGPAGPKGATGPQGPSGPAGVGLVKGAIVFVVTGSPGPSGFTLIGTSNQTYTDRSGKNVTKKYDVYQF